MTLQDRLCWVTETASGHPVDFVTQVAPGKSSKLLHDASQTFDIPNSDVPKKTLKASFGRVAHLDSTYADKEIEGFLSIYESKSMITNVELVEPKMKLPGGLKAYPAASFDDITTGVNEDQSVWIVGDSFAMKTQMKIGDLRTIEFPVILTCLNDEDKMISGYAGVPRDCTDADLSQQYLRVRTAMKEIYSKKLPKLSKIKTEKAENDPEEVRTLFMYVIRNGYDEPLHKIVRKFQDDRYTKTEIDVINFVKQVRLGSFVGQKIYRLTSGHVLPFDVDKLLKQISESQFSAISSQISDLVRDVIDYNSKNPDEKIPFRDFMLKVHDIPFENSDDDDALTMRSVAENIYQLDFEDILIDFWSRATSQKTMNVQVSFKSSNIQHPGKNFVPDMTKFAGLPKEGQLYRRFWGTFLQDEDAVVMWEEKTFPHSDDYVFTEKMTQEKFQMNWARVTGALRGASTSFIVNQLVTLNVEESGKDDEMLSWRSSCGKINDVKVIYPVIVAKSSSLHAAKIARMNQEVLDHVNKHNSLSFFNGSFRPATAEDECCGEITESSLPFIANIEKTDASLLPELAYIDVQNLALVLKEASLKKGDEDLTQLYGEICEMTLVRMSSELQKKGGDLSGMNPSKHIKLLVSSTVAIPPPEVYHPKKEKKKETEQKEKKEEKPKGKPNESDRLDPKSWDLGPIRVQNMAFPQIGVYGNGTTMITVNQTIFAKIVDKFRGDGVPISDSHYNEAKKLGIDLRKKDLRDLNVQGFLQSLDGTITESGSDHNISIDTLPKQMHSIKLVDLDEKQRKFIRNCFKESYSTVIYKSGSMSPSVSGGGPVGLQELGVPKDLCDPSKWHGNCFNDKLRTEMSTELRAMITKGKRMKSGDEKEVKKMRDAFENAFKHGSIEALGRVFEKAAKK